MTKTNNMLDAYCEVNLDVPNKHADAVCNFIIDNICSGLVLEEEENSPVTGIKFYIPTGDTSKHGNFLKNYLSQLVDESMPEVPAIREKIIKNVEWTEQYKRSIEPLRINRDLLIRPPWIKAQTDFKYDIIIEPKMAFGTGRHETTRTCLKIMLGIFQPGWRVLDFGCGSGILSILAGKMNASYIKAVDHDLGAIDNIQENFMINNITTPHDIEFGSMNKCRQDEPYDFIVVNIIKSTILPIIKDLSGLMKKNGRMLLSGLLEPDLEEISSELKKNGLDNFTYIQDNGWFTYNITKE